MDEGIERIWPAIVAAAREGCAPPIEGFPDLDPDERALLEVYLDFLREGVDGLQVTAHLGTSLCGRIATRSGHSTFVTGDANLLHMQRLRALADVVLVGAGTVHHDDPQLTVRRVAGSSPVRAVIDPAFELKGHFRVFTDHAAPTLRLGRADRVRAACRAGGFELVAIEPGEGGQLSAHAILEALRARGLRRIFIEGGGRTVSDFMAQAALDELQLCIAPVIIGSGREALILPEIETMHHAIRLSPRVLRMGGDLLHVCPLARRPLGVPIDGSARHLATEPGD